MTLDELNALPEPAARNAFERCCGSHVWVQAMCAGRPYADRQTLVDAAERVAETLRREDWLEAFSHHPRIGDRAAQYAPVATAEWARQEQSAASGGSDVLRSALETGNSAYEAKFGYIFIVCASGRPAQEILALLTARLTNDPATEIRIAAREQRLITRLRLEKLLSENG